MTPQRREAAGAPEEPVNEAEDVPVDTDAATNREATSAAKGVTADRQSAIVRHHTDDVSDADEPAEAPTTISVADNDSAVEDPEKAKAAAGTRVSQVFAYGVLPVLILILTVTAGYWKWQESSMRAATTARVESVAAAREGTIAILSYQADTAEKDLGAAEDRLTSTFKESYTQLINDVVIPGAKQRHISAVATVPAAASVSATGSHAVVLVFVNQTIVVGKDAPSASASSVRVKLDKVGHRWLISGFDPI